MVWALYGQRRLGAVVQKVPMEDKCERCFKVSCCFPAKTFGELCCARNTQPKSPLALCIKEAEANLDKSPEGVLLALGAPEQCEKKASYTLEMTPTVRMLSERDLKTLAAATRMSKVAIRGVPTVNFPRLDGGEGMQPFFIFPPSNVPEGVGVPATLRIAVAAERSTMTLVPGNRLWKGQGDHILAHNFAGMVTASDETSFMYKLANGSLLTLDTVISRWKAQKRDGADDDEEAPEVDEGEFIGTEGIAAGAVVAATPEVAPRRRRSLPFSGGRGGSPLFNN